MEWDKLLTPEEAGEILRVSPKTIRAWLKDKKIKGLKVGGVWRIKEDDLRALLAGEPKP